MSKGRSDCFGRVHNDRGGVGATTQVTAPLQDIAYIRNSRECYLCFRNISASTTVHIGAGCDIATARADDRQLIVGSWSALDRRRQRQRHTHDCHQQSNSHPWRSDSQKLPIPHTARRPMSLDLGISLTRILASWPLASLQTGRQLPAQQGLELPQLSTPTGTLHQLFPLQTAYP